MSTALSRPRFLGRAALALLSVLSVASSLSAASYVWDPANTANGSTLDAGSGTWDLSGTNTVWNDGTTNVAWSQTNATTALHSAQFAGADAPDGTSYTITLGASVAINTTSNALRFSNNGYILTAPVGSNHTITTRQITTDSGKTATLSGPLTLSLTNTTGVNQINGYGTLIAKDGVKITPAGNPTFNIGSKLRLQSGSVYTSGGSVIVGGQSTDGSATSLTVEGGAMNISGTNIALILANVNSITAQYSNTVVTLSSGNITNTSAGGGIRFGGSSGTSTNNTNVNGTVNLDGGVLTIARVYESNGTATAYNSTFNFNGGTLRAVASTANGATFMQTLNNAYVKSGGALIDTNGANITIGQPLLADTVSTGGGLTKLGAGTLTLTGANTYTGNTTVSAGTLSVVAPFSALTATTVAPSARLQIVSGATASSLPALTLQAGSGVELNLGVYSAANLSTAAFASLDAAGDYLIDLTGTNVPVGSYTVFTYGSKTGTGVPSLGVLPPGVTGNLQDTGSAIVLNVLTPQVANYIWSTPTAGNWDTTSTNWTGQTYSEGSVATFPNLAGVNTVTLTADRSPFSVAIQNNYSANSTLNSTYTFTGSAIAGSAAVTKTGTGVLTLASANTYTGATAINGGVVLVSADAALGSASGGTTIASGASLALTGGLTYTTAEPLVLSGSGYDTTIDTLTRLRGAIQSVSGNSTFAGALTIGSGGTRLGAQNGASLTLSGTIAPAAGVIDSSVYFRPGDTAGDFITLSGTNNQWNSTASFYTNCAATSGFAGVRLGTNNALPTTVSITAGGTFAGTGNTLDLNGYNQTLPGLVNSDGNLQIANLRTGTTSVLTLDTATADFSNEAGAANTENEFTLIANGTGTVALVKKGTFKQTLTGSHTYSGSTTIEAGTLAFAGAASLGATPVMLSAGSTLDVSGISATDFALSGGLSGSGTLTATAKTVTVSSAFTPGALAISGNLTLDAGTATTLVAAATPDASSAVTVNGALALNGTLAITEAGGFDFATGQTFTFATATGGVTAGLTGVTVNAVALTEATPDVWTASIDGLNYTFTESTATLAVSGGVAISAIQTWRDLHFPNEGNDGTGIGANTADADGDGIANLLEYATNTSPRTANAPVVVQGTNAGRLTLTFPRIDDPTLRYTVEGRDDLAAGAWAAVTPAAANNPSFGFAGQTPGVTETQSETVVDTVVITAQPRRFLRLSVDFVQAP